LLASRNEVRRQSHRPDDRELVERGDALVGDHGGVACDFAREDDMERLEENTAHVVPGALRQHVVDRLSLLEEPSELLAVSCEWTT
jgi:hypothetical protein